jgi:hypothetical protein
MDEVSANISLPDLTGMDQGCQISRANFFDANNHALGKGKADIL